MSARLVVGFNFFQASLRAGVNASHGFASAATVALDHLPAVFDRWARHPVWAAHDAHEAAYAVIMVAYDKSVVALCKGSAYARLDACGFIAVPAEFREEQSAAVQFYFVP